MEKIEAFVGDCLKHLEKMPDHSVDLVYLDPPFFTQKIQRLSTRDGDEDFLFSDVWSSHREYTEFMGERLVELKRIIKKTGSVFFHCDRNAAHIARVLLDKIFGEDNFQSEIIWYYKRWSNSKKGLTPAHQNIFFYSKTRDFSFNRIVTGYSPTTNTDQIIQKRVRDGRGKAIYARDHSGNIISNGAKKGVPLNDVWEIPYLNPKARERVGYPTQKPILLLERIIELTTQEGDLVLDPFCGSGTTLVAAKLLGRRAIGIDNSKEAIRLTEARLNAPVKTESRLLKKGKDAYINPSNSVGSHLKDVDFVPVHRNLGMDAILKDEVDGKPVFVRVQRSGEELCEAGALLKKAARTKGNSILVVIATRDELFEEQEISGVTVVNSTSLEVSRALKKLRSSGVVNNP